METLLITGYFVIATIIYILAMYVMYLNGERWHEAAGLSAVMGFTWPILLPITIIACIFVGINRGLYKIFDYIGKYKVTRCED